MGLRIGVGGRPYVGIGRAIELAVTGRGHQRGPAEIRVERRVVQPVAHVELAGAGGAALREVAVQRLERHRVDVHAAIGQRIAAEVLRQRGQPQRDLVGRRPQQLRAAATHIGIVDVLPPARDVVDVAGVLAAVRIHPQGELVLHQRQVDHAVRVEAAVAAGDAIAADLQAPGEARAVRRRGDELQQAAQRVRAVQGALRAAQHLDAQDVVRIDVRREHAAGGVDRARSVRDVVDVGAHGGIGRIRPRGMPRRINCVWPAPAEIRLSPGTSAA
ncbi:hypothetical protein STENM36S_02038 [Streptomyces tendae]